MFRRFVISIQYHCLSFLSSLCHSNLFMLDFGMLPDGGLRRNIDNGIYEEARGLSLIVIIMLLLPPLTH